MDMNNEDILKALKNINSLLDALVLARRGDSLNVESVPEQLQSIAEKLNTLNDNISDAIRFGASIAHGNLEIEPPNRYNYLAGPYKEIQSQLSSFTWSIKQLMEGNMVSKLYYPGELFQQYNALIEKVSQTFSTQGNDSPTWGSTVTSWRYHQILSAINHLHIMIVEVGANGTIIFANPPAREILGDMQTLPYAQNSQQEQEQDPLIDYMLTFANHESYDEDMFPVLYELHIEESRSWYKITTDKIRLTDGSMGLLHMIDDISDWKHHEEKLRISATYDTLSGAYARKAGFSKLNELINQRFDSVHQAAFFDIDGLKDINDIHGHNEGDFAIKTVAGILISSVRDSDWVIRYGGDEFLVLFLDCPEDVANRIVNRMYGKLDKVNQEINKPYTLSFSYGLSPITKQMKTAADLITVIDERMYKHKQMRKEKQ